MRDNEPMRPTPKWQFDNAARGPVDWRTIENNPQAWREAEEAMLRHIRAEDWDG
jgi:hypothetical protein